MNEHKKKINYYKSFYDVSKKLNQKQFYEFNMAIYDVMFFEKDIESISFSDNIVELLWSSIKHSLTSSIEGYCSKQNIDYKGLFNTLDKGVDKGVTNNANVKEKEKEKDKEKDNVKEKDNDNIKDIVAYLNLKANTNYKASSEKTRSLIKARINEGFTLEDFKTVIDKKVLLWGKDLKMSAYLRPETLFGNKFESYLNEIISNAKILVSKGIFTEKTAKTLDLIEEWLND